MSCVVIRADASRRIGLGHVKRCLALALALRDAGSESVFLARGSDVDVAALVAASGFELRRLPGPALGSGTAGPGSWLPVSPEQDAADCATALRGQPPRAVVVDHYALDARWHHAVREASGAPLAAIDDLADRPLAVDLLIDPNPSADHGRKYAAVLASPARLCTGPRHALLDPVYRRTPLRPWSATVHSIGIFMGGTDPGQHSRLAWSACREHAGWRGPIEIASTSANARLSDLRALCARDPLLSLSVDQPDLAAFHARHDLQVGAGGGALWERCALGVPTLALICAPNQRLSVPLLAEAGVVQGFDAVTTADGSAAELGAAVARLAADPAARASLRQRSLALVDGRGAARAAAALLALPC